MSKEPKKPKSIPKEAVWNASDNEWELGKKNNMGVCIGEWKWWLAPKGHLCCHTFFEGDSGNDFTFTRFHPDGTPSRQGRYKNGREDGIVAFTKSEHETDEFFALPFNEEFDHIWKAELLYDKGTVKAENYYDKEGKKVELNYYIKHEEETDEDHSGSEKQEITFNRVEEASERWIREGKAFKDAINAWLDVIYIEDKQPSDPEPKETRTNMAPYVLKKIIEFNEKGEHKKLRELFPPDYDPFIDEYENDLCFGSGQVKNTGGVIMDTILIKAHCQFQCKSILLII